MGQGLSGKWVEVVILALAGIAFGIWQLRDTKRALERSRAERLAREAQERKEAAKAVPPEEHPS